MTCCIIIHDNYILLESFINKILIWKLFSCEEPERLSLGKPKKVNTVIDNGKVIIVCCQYSVVWSSLFNWNIKEPTTFIKTNLSKYSLTWYSIKVDHKLSIFWIYNSGIAIDKHVQPCTENRWIIMMKYLTTRQI